MLKVNYIKDSNKMMYKSVLKIHKDHFLTKILDTWSLSDKILLQ